MSIDINRLESEDLKDCEKCLAEILDKSIKVDEVLVAKIGQMIKRASGYRTISIKLAEDLLFNVATIIEKEGPALPCKFGENAEFIDALVMIILDFKTRLSPEASTSLSFASHYCYELCVYMVVTLVETVPLLKVFVKTISEESLTSLFAALCSILPRDFLFVTQVYVVVLIELFAKSVAGNGFGGCLPNVSFLHES